MVIYIVIFIVEKLAHFTNNLYFQRIYQFIKILKCCTHFCHSLWHSLNFIVCFINLPSWSKWLIIIQNLSFLYSLPLDNPSPRINDLPCHRFRMIFIELFTIKRVWVVYGHFDTLQHRSSSRVVLSLHWMKLIYIVIESTDQLHISHRRDEWRKSSCNSR